MDSSIHVRNKTGNYLLSKELEDLPAKSSQLLLPPLISEDASMAKLKYMTQLQDDMIRKQQEQARTRKEERARLSLLKQQFYKIHNQSVTFDPNWRLAPP
jgi:hypothetical protein